MPVDSSPSHPCPFHPCGRGRLGFGHSLCEESLPQRELQGGHTLGLRRTVLDGQIRLERIKWIHKIRVAAFGAFGWVATKRCLTCQEL